MTRHSILDQILNRPSQTYSAPDGSGDASRIASPRGWQAPTDLPNASGGPSSILSGSMFSRRSGALGGGGSVAGSRAGGSSIGRFGRRKKNAGGSVAGSAIDDGASTVAESTAAGSLAGRRRSRWWETGSLRGFGGRGRAPSISESVFSEPAAEPSSDARWSGMAGIGAGSKRGPRSDYGGPASGMGRSSGATSPPPLPRHDPQALRAMNAGSPVKAAKVGGVAPLGQGAPSLIKPPPAPSSTSGSVRGGSKRSKSRLGASSNPSLATAFAAQPTPLVQKRAVSGVPASASDDWRNFVQHMGTSDGTQNLDAAAARMAGAASPLGRRRSVAERVRRELEQDAQFEQTQRDPGVIHQDLIARAAQQVIGDLPPTMQGSAIDDDDATTDGGHASPNARRTSFNAVPPSNLRPGNILVEPAPAAHQQMLAQVALQQHAAMAGQQGVPAQHLQAFQQHAQAHSSAIPQHPLQRQPPAEADRPMSPSARPLSAASLNRDLPPPPPAAEAISSDEDASSSGEEASSEGSSDDEDEAGSPVIMLDVVAEEDEEGSSNGGHEMRPQTPGTRRAALAGTAPAEAAQNASALAPAIAVQAPSQAGHGGASSDLDEAPEAVETLLGVKKATSGGKGTVSAASVKGVSFSGAADASGDDSDATSRGGSIRSAQRPATLSRRLSDVSLGGSFAMSALLRSSSAPQSRASSRRLRMNADDSDSAGEKSDGDDELRARAREESARLRNMKVGDDFFGDSLTSVLDRFNRTNWSDSTINRLGLEAPTRQASSSTPATAATSGLSAGDTMAANAQQRVLEVRQQRAEIAAAQGASGLASETRSLESAIAPSFAAYLLFDDAQSVRSRKAPGGGAEASHARQASNASASSDKNSASSHVNRFKSLFASSSWADAPAAPEPPKQSVMDRPRLRPPKPTDMGGVPIAQGKLEPDSPANAKPVEVEDTRSTFPASMTPSVSVTSSLLASPTKPSTAAPAALASASPKSTTSTEPASKDKPAPAKSALKPLKHSRSLADTLFSPFGPSKEEKKKAKAKAAGFAAAEPALNAAAGAAAPPSAWAKKESKIAKAERKAAKNAPKKPAAPAPAGVAAGTAAASATAAAVAASVAASSSQASALSASTSATSLDVPPPLLTRASSNAPLSPGLSETDAEERWMSADEGATPDVAARPDWLSPASPSAAFRMEAAAKPAPLALEIPPAPAPGGLPSAASVYLDASAQLPPAKEESNGATLATTTQFYTARELAVPSPQVSPEKAKAVEQQQPNLGFSDDTFAVQSFSFPAAPAAKPAPAPVAAPAAEEEDSSDDESDSGELVAAPSPDDILAKARGSIRSPPPSSELWSGESAASTVLSTPAASEVQFDRKPLAERRSDSSPGLTQPPSPTKKLPMPPPPSFDDSVMMPPLADDATPLAVMRSEPTFGALTPRADQRPEPTFAQVGLNLIPPTPPALESRQSFGASRAPGAHVGSVTEEEGDETSSTLQRSTSKGSSNGHSMSTLGQGSSGAGLVRSSSSASKRGSGAVPPGFQVYTGKGLSLPPGLVATTVASSSARRGSSDSTSGAEMPASPEQEGKVRRKKSKKSSSKRASQSMSVDANAPPVPAVPSGLLTPRRGSDAGSSVGSSGSASPSPAPSVSASGSVVSSTAGSAVSDVSATSSSRGAAYQAPYPRKIRTLSAGPSGQARTAVMSAISEWESSPISDSNMQLAPNPVPSPLSARALSPAPYAQGPYPSLPPSSVTRSNSSVNSSTTPAMVRNAPLGSSTDTYLPIPRSRRSMDGSVSPVPRGYGDGVAQVAQSLDGHSSRSVAPYAESSVSRDSSPSASQSAMSLPSVPMSSYRPNKDPKRISNSIDDRLYARTTMNTVSVSSGAFRSSSRAGRRRSMDTAAPAPGAQAGKAAAEAVPEHLQDELGQTTMALTSHTPPPRKLTSTQVLCQIIAVAIDELDRMILREKVRSDNAYGFVPGRSFCGRVMEAGWEVKKMRKGDVIFGLQNSRKCGALAEFMVIDQDLVAKAPEDCLTTEQIAALPSTGVMAYQLMQNHCSQLPKGARVLILNAHDGVGLLTMQESAPLGLIIVAQCPPSISDGVAVCEANGAHEVVIGEPLWALNSLHESSFDLVIDTIGGRRIYDASRRILAQDGQFTTCFGDEQNGANPNLRSHLRSLRRNFFKKDRKSIGYEWVGADQGEDCREALEAVRAAAENGDICPRLSSILPFADAPRAFDPVIRGTEEEPGAVVVRVS